MLRRITEILQSPDKISTNENINWDFRNPIVEIITEILQKLIQTAQHKNSN